MPNQEVQNSDPVNVNQEVTEDTKGDENRETETQQTKTFTLTQEELDSRISKAIQTREINLKKEYDREMLAKEQKWQELSDSYKSELEEYKAEAQRNKFLSEVTSLAAKHNMNDYLDVMVDLPNMEAVNRFIDKTSSLTNSRVETTIKERLTVSKPIHSKEVPANQLTSESWAERRKSEFGLQDLPVLGKR